MTDHATTCALPVRNAVCDCESNSQRWRDKRRIMDVLNSKQPPVPILADMLEEARAQAWEACLVAATETVGTFRGAPPNPYRQEKR